MPPFPAPTPDDRSSARGLFLAQLKEIAQHGEHERDRIAAASAGLRAIAHIEALAQRDRRLNQRDREFKLARRYLALAEQRERRRGIGFQPMSAGSAAERSAHEPTQLAAPAAPKSERPPPLTDEERTSILKLFPLLKPHFLISPFAAPFWRKSLAEHQQRAASSLPLPDGSEGRGVGSCRAANEASPELPERTSATDKSADSPGATGGSSASAVHPKPHETPEPPLSLPDGREGRGEGVGHAGATGGSSASAVSPERADAPPAPLPFIFPPDIPFADKYSVPIQRDPPRRSRSP